VKKRANKEIIIRSFLWDFIFTVFWPNIQKFEQNLLEKMANFNYFTELDHQKFRKFVVVRN